jgi:murein tripeptide amidase MpaA
MTVATEGDMSRAEIEQLETDLKKAGTLVARESSGSSMTGRIMTGGWFGSSGNTR